MIWEEICAIEDAKQDEEKIIEEAVSSLKKVPCRLCRADHWTAKCPSKDNLQSIVQWTKEKGNENSSSSRTNVSNPTTNERSTGWGVSRRVTTAQVQHTNERNTSNRTMNEESTNPYWSGRNNDLRKEDFHLPFLFQIETKSVFLIQMKPLFDWRIDLKKLKNKIDEIYLFHLVLLVASF